MYPNYYLSPLAVALAIGLSTSAQAAQPVSLPNQSFQELSNQFLLGTVKNQRQAAVFLNKLELVKQHTDKKQTTHSRMQQYYAGFPVLGGYAILHHKGSLQSLSQTAAVAMNGTVYEGLQAELGQPDSLFIAQGQDALKQFEATYAKHPLSEKEVVPVIFIDAQNKAHWAYKVSLLVEHQDKIPERPTAIIDAQTKATLLQWDNIKTAISPAKGMGYGGNSKIGEYQFGKDFPLLEIGRDAVKELCYMETADVKVVDMKHKYSSKNTPMVFACKDETALQDNTYYTGYAADGYDKENGASSPSNDAMYSGYVIKHMYHDWYGIEALTQPNGKPMQLVMRVHYGDAYENAYWDGRQMTFGDGDTMMYPLVSLGVGAHEVSHGFTEQNSSLEYYGQSGGMNEAFSDMAAQAAEYYSTGKSSWTIGSEIMKEGSGYEALRYMDRPSKDGSSIDSADEYYGGLDVHYSSGVYNRLFYILSNQSGWDVRKAFDVMVKANMDYWTPYSSFEEGGCGVIHAAQDLGYSLNEVKQSLKAVAINYTTCKV